MSGDDLIIGLDAGTSVIKAVVFDLAGRQIAAAGLRNSYERDAAGAAVEQDLARTWADVVKVLRQLGDQVPDLARRATALAVTGQGDGTCLIGRDGTPVAPAWLWLDTRAAPIVEEMAANGARTAAYRATGSGMNASNQSGHLVWLDRHRPELLDCADYACHVKDWLYLNLTGERVTDVSEAVFTFGNYRTRAYDDTVIEAFGLKHRRRLLPPIVDSLTGTHHPLSHEAAQTLGLRPGLPVVLGYVDVLCTALAAGLYDETGRGGVSIIGSTGMHMRLADPRTVDLLAEPSGYTMCFVPGSVARSQSNMAATINIDWLLDLTRQAVELLGHDFDRERALAAFERMVAAEKPAQALYHPYIDRAGERGPFMEARARAQIVGLSNAVGFSGITRSVYEGLALAARDCFASIGGPPQELRIAGGAARSRSLKQIYASVLAVDVREADRDEAGAAGAAMMATVCLGIEPDMTACCRTWVAPTLGGVIVPERKLAPVYDAQFAIYQSLRDEMRPHWCALAAVPRCST
jgi:erythritol kinase